ncbi:flagellar basal body rod protein FlgC [Labrys wisconsinensis]|uniref:Flagellar basal-body rod protein FlgC n=1 Tax=Labrys wisconsinensis TaxID=425677 RepID=A0ABU0JD32_9HYPH|nr:flagellar basal body rod protein FlgC [Labrys wisconsinensis]MDQ0471421.1 flagellar basal-body rod protein FlgC [Labrys wisconsinensis]
MDLTRAIGIASSGLKAESGRMRVIAENLANADSTATTPGGDPYRRKVATFGTEIDRDLDAQVVRLGRVRRDASAFRTEYEPGNPAADAQGYVKMPNVNPLIEQMDMREAQRAYEANLNVIGAARRMIARTLDILRG